MVRLSDFTRWEVHSEVEYRLSTSKGVSEGLILDLSSAESTTAVKATGPTECLSTAESTTAIKAEGPTKSLRQFTANDSF